jgi:hypothetical protein
MCIQVTEVSGRIVAAIVRFSEEMLLTLSVTRRANHLVGAPTSSNI